MPASRPGSAIRNVLVAALVIAGLIVVVRTFGPAGDPGDPRDAAVVAPADSIVRLAAELEALAAGAPSGQVRVERRPVDLVGRLRDAIAVETAGELVLPADDLAGARGRVSLAAEPLQAKPKRATTVVFDIALRGPEGSTSLLHEELRAMPDERARWQEHTFELPAGTEGAQGTELVFSVRFKGPAMRALWGSPVLFPTAPQTRPNVILVSIDTLGANHMSCYGYEEQTTPNIDRFAEGAVVFDQAITHQSWTLTAHMSLFTSLYPDTHKVGLGTSLSPALPMLPGLLRDAGYYTAGRASNVYLSPKYGYGPAYDWYTLETRRSIEDAAVELDKLLAPPMSGPLFLFLHVIDPHSDWRRLPYETPQPYMPEPPEGGWTTIETCFEGRCATRYLAQVNEGNVTLGSEIDLFRTLYDHGVRYTDHHLGRIFDDLERRGLLENSLVIITSDHGEEFLEHGKVMHTQGYDECLRVPLIVRFPGREHAGLRIPHQVQHVDVLPTVLDLLGIEFPPSVEGKSLLPLLSGRTPEERIAYSKGENHSMTARDSYVARTEDWKLIWWLEDERTALYDLRADPGERTDVKDDNPDVHDELLGALQQHRQLRNTGLHLRIPPHDAKSTLKVNATTTGRLVRVTDVNPNVRANGPTIELSHTDAEFSFSVEPRSRNWWNSAVGIDFDLEPADAELELVFELDGAPLPATSIRLGAAGEHPAANPLRFTADRAALDDASRPMVLEDTPAPTAVLWESRTNVETVDLTDDERSVLEALGYVGTEEDD